MRLKIISLAIFVLIISACSGRNDNLDITPTIAGIEQPLGLAPTPEEEVLRIDNLNKVPPNDVIQEIAYFGGLGSGGGCLPVSFGKPTFLIDYSQGADVEVYSPVKWIRKFRVENGHN